MPTSGISDRRGGRDIVTQTANGVELGALWQEFSAVLAVQNARKDTLKALCSAPFYVAHKPILRAQPTSAFERASEFGEPVATRAELEYVQRGFTFNWHDARITMTWRYLAETDSSEITAGVSAVMADDHDAVQRAVLGAALNPAERRNREGDAVKGFYNGDGEVPPTFNGYSYTGTETQFITTASADLAGADVTALIKKVTLKGYGPLSGAQLVLIVNPADSRRFVRLRAGSGAADGDYDFALSAGAPARFEATPIVGSRAPADYNGLAVAGSYGPALVVESDLMPRGYVLCLASYGPNSLRNPVGFREHAQASLRGLLLKGGGNPDYPLIDSFFVHGFGSGVQHRGAGAVLQITTATTYTAPTEYSAGTF